MQIKKPIILFGTGRSGTTIFHQMLSEHPDFTWLSSLCDKYPDKLVLNRLLMTLLDNPLFEKLFRKKIKARECYGFWEFYSKGFGAPCRDLLATDVSVKMKNNIVKAVSDLSTEKRNRPLIKITGWPRIGFLSEVFNDAKFIHLIRDGRAVANSLINVGFWRGWGGPEKWRWGPLSEAHQETWDNHNQSFIVLAAIQWQILMDAAEEAKRYLDKSRIMEVKYEELCSNPLEICRHVANFCEIEWNDCIESRLKKYNLTNTNNKYKNELSLQQREDLMRVLDNDLERYGYK